MTRIVRHNDDDTKPLFQFPVLAGYSSDDNRLIFLSERSFNILLNCLPPIEQMQTRVYTSRLSGSRYEVVSDEEFETFQEWISDIRTSMGGYNMANEYLLRIAEALESLDAKTAEFVSMKELVDEIGDTLGLAHPVFLLIKWFTDNFPSLAVKIDATEWAGKLFNYVSWNMPLMAQITAHNSSLAIIAASAAGSSVFEAAKTMRNDFWTFIQNTGKVYDWVTGGNPWKTLWDGLWDLFTSDEDGGTGGEDPDNDPALRSVINVFNNNPIEINMDCCPTGSGAGGTGGCSPIDGGSSPGSVSDIPPVNSPDPESPPPDDFPSWDDYMCRAASWWIDRYIGTLRNLGGLSGFIGGLTIAVVAGLLALTVPPFGIVVILAALGTLIGIDLGLMATFNTLADDLEEDKDEIVCELIGAADTNTAKDLMTARVQEKLATYGLSTIPWAALEEIALNVMANANLRVIFEDTGDVPSDYTADCSSCEEGEAAYTVVQGIETSSPPANPIIGYTPDPQGGSYSCTVAARPVHINFHSPVTITGILQDGTDLATCVGQIPYWYYTGENGTGTLLYSGSAGPESTGPIANVRSLYFYRQVSSGNMDWEVTYTT